jgi:hypothetical protein
VLCDVLAKSNPISGRYLMTNRDERWFRTACGRNILLNAIHIRSFDHGFLEGRAELIRKKVLGELADTASELIRGTSAVFIESLDCPGDSYPPLTFFCGFTCYNAVGPSTDCSSLTAVWFAKDLNLPIPEMLRPHVAALDWAEHAADGYW